MFTLISIAKNDLSIFSTFRFRSILNKTNAGAKTAGLLYITVNFYVVV